MPRHFVRSHSENPLYPKRTRLRETLSYGRQPGQPVRGRVCAAVTHGRPCPPERGPL